MKMGEQRVETGDRKIIFVADDRDMKSQGIWIGYALASNADDTFWEAGTKLAEERAAGKKSNPMLPGKLKDYYKKFAENARKVFSPKRSLDLCVI
jgi:hypothetical protein